MMPRKKRTRTLYCPACLLEFEKLEDMGLLGTCVWIALRCPGCDFEVWTPIPERGYAPLEDSLIKLGARTYVLRTPPGRANSFC